MSILKSRQRGMTITGWVMMIGVSLFFVLLGIKMVPAYTEFHSIDSIVQGLKDEPRLKQGNAREIRKALAARFNINSIYDFDTNNISIKKTKDGTNVQIEYEVRESVAGNVFVVMEFFTEVNL